mgnify:FL=1
MNRPLCIYLAFRPAEQIEMDGTRRPVMEEYCAWAEYHREEIADMPDWLWSAAMGSVCFQPTQSPRPSCRDCLAYVAAPTDEGGDDE